MTRAEKHSTRATAPGYFDGVVKIGLPRASFTANVQLDCSGAESLNATRLGRAGLYAR